MFIQAIIDLIIVLLMIWLIGSAIKKLLISRETPVTLSLRINELKEQRTKLEELEKEVVTTQSLVEVKKKMDQLNTRIKDYEEQLKRKESRGKTDGK